MQAKTELEKRRLVLSPQKQALLEKALQRKTGRVSSPVRIPRRSAEMREFAPASFSQQRIWFLEQLDPGHTTYNFSEALRLEGELDYAALQRSFTEIVRRHEVLRTTFTAIEGNPIQRVNAAEPLPLPLADVSHIAEQWRMQEAQRLLDEAAQTPFDLQRPPLLRPFLVRLAPQKHLLLISVHHIASDGWSMGIITKELSACYNAFIDGQPSPLPELPVQYADYAVWQQEWLKGEALERQLNYWKQKMAGAPTVLEFPAQRPRPARQSYKGRTLTFFWSRTLLDQLHGLGRAEGVTLFMLLIAAFQVVLGRYTQQEDMVVGSLTANRTQVEIENLIGFFVNTLVLRTNLGDKPTFREVLKRVRNMTLEAYDYQDVPFEQVVEAIQPERNLSYSPLFQVLFILQSGLGETMRLGNMKLTATPVENNTAPFDLTFDLTEIRTGLRGSLRYNSDIFDQEMMKRLIEHLRSLLEYVVIQPEVCIWEIPLLTSDERHLLFPREAPSAMTLPRTLDFLELFADQRDRRPYAPAVCDPQQTMSYEQLDAHANTLARQLQLYGVGPETPVAVLLTRGCPLLCTLLALFKLRATYLPLDPMQPPARLHHILARCAPPLLLTQADLLSKAEQVVALFPSSSAPHLAQLDLWLLLDPLPSFSTPPPLPHQLAYLLFTSGSTGEPKGVMVEQEGMLNHLLCKVEDLDLCSTDRVAQTASQCFDISLWQLLAALLVGATVHIFPDEISHDPHLLLQHIEQDQISVLQVVPSMLSALLDELELLGAARPMLPALRWVISTGEALPPALCRRWLACYPHIPLLNAYGPTEASDDVTHALITQPPAEELARMPIGSALSNTRLYILGRYGELLPLGAHGELYIGGRGVARGYLVEPAKTAEVFVPDAYSGQPGARLYRTGDLVCYRSNGSIEFLGRRDQQVKLRGFRIELGEIENLLRRHTLVQDCAVMVREEKSGDKWLVVYIVPHQDQEQDFLKHALSSVLQEHLPPYMVPSVFLFLEALPLTSNGKVDQRALSILDIWEQDADLSKNDAAPRDSVELQLVQIWEDLLRVRPVRVTDDFFELGGHSLLAVRLMAQIQSVFQQNLPLSTLFQGATIAHLADLLRQQKSEHAYSLLVPLQKASSGHPFFCVHPIGGGVLCYLDLARTLGPDQPVYALQAAGLYGEQSPSQHFEEMAERYIQALRAVQPHGPYYLGGWSMGGVIAFEMARQLQAQGEDIALLALFDSYAPAPSLYEDESPDREVSQFIEDLASQLGIKEKVYPMLLEPLSPDERLEHLMEHMVQADLLPTSSSIDDLRNRLHVFHANMQALRSYRPQAYPGDLHLIRASEKVSQEEQEHTNGWSKLISGSITVQILPGNHYTLLQKPAMQALAEYLRAHLS